MLGKLITWLRGVVGRNPWFSAALTAGAGLRLLAMLGYPGALWFAGDSYVYVGAALRPQPNQSKSTGYSLFLRMLLPFHSFTLVTAVQHLMGLAIAVMIYVLARRAGVSRKWATIATLPQLLDGFVIEDEHMIMAETVFTCCLFVAMLLLLWRPRTSWWVALICGLLVGYATIVRTEGAIVLLVFPLFLLLRYWSQLGWRSLRGWLVTAVMAIGCLVPVGGYVLWFHSSYGNYGLTRSTGFYLWGRVSSFADCSKIHASADVMKVCPHEPLTKRSAPGSFIWSTCDIHDYTSCKGRSDITGSPVNAANNTLLTKFAIAAIESQPLDYAKAVVKGLVMSVEWPRKNYPGAGTVFYYDFHQHYATSKYSVLPPKNKVWITGASCPKPGVVSLKCTAYGDWLSYGGQEPGRVIKIFALPILAWGRLIYTYGPLFGLIMVMGLGGVLRITRRPWRLRWQPRAGSMLPWVSAVALLVTPIALADFDYRYLIPVLPFACLAAGLGFAPARVKAAPAAPDTGSTQASEPATQDA